MEKKDFDEMYADFKNAFNQDINEKSKKRLFACLLDYYGADFLFYTHYNLCETIRYIDSDKEDNNDSLS